MTSPGYPMYDMSAMYTSPALIHLENWNGPAEQYNADTVNLSTHVPGQDIDAANVVLLLTAIITSVQRAAGFIWNMGIKLNEIIKRINHIQVGMHQLARKVEVMEHIQGGGGGGAGRSRSYQNIDNFGSDKFGFRLWHERFNNELTQVQPASRSSI